MRDKEQWTNSVDLEVDPVLLVGWRPRARQLDGAIVELHEDTFADLRAVARDSLNDLARMEPIAYSDAVLPVLGEEYLRRALEDLPVKAPEVSRGSADKATETSRVGSSAPEAEEGQDEEAERVADLLRLVKGLGELEFVSAGQLADGDFAFYGVCFPQPDGEMIAFIRGINPTRVLSRAAFFGRFQGALRRSERPDLLLEGQVDLVITGDELAIIRRSTYDRLFADLEELASAVPSDVQALSTTFPKLDFAPGSAEALQNLCVRLSSLAKRVHRLAARTDLAGLNAETLKSRLREHGEDPSHWFDQANSLTLTEDRARQFLDVVEGRWWTADFTDERRRADAYRRR